jgi:pantothenate kinase type III
MTNKQSMILLIDVGNTSTTLGLWNGSRVVKTGRAPTSTREAAVVLAEVRHWLGHRVVADAVLSTVVPAVRPLWGKVCGALGAPHPLDVNHKLKLGVKISYPHPEGIGADRLPVAVRFGRARRFARRTDQAGLIPGARWLSPPYSCPLPDALSKPSLGLQPHPAAVSS